MKACGVCARCLKEVSPDDCTECYMIRQGTFKTHSRTTRHIDCSALGKRLKEEQEKQRKVYEELQRRLARYNQPKPDSKRERRTEVQTIGDFFKLEKGKKISILI